ncbi:hypothetical protein J1N35_016893 [Gossypium stocksii]|uniref:Uncharacterized protein n=1 Tax=Gossypium stocksii TaxID=47602 RepID=A0A9D4A5P9_9ROSI|nr:hypothetical protein J1N35_016893 [Gossypium stocksii]
MFISPALRRGTFEPHPWLLSMQPCLELPQEIGLPNSQKDAVSKKVALEMVEFNLVQLVLKSGLKASTSTNPTDQPGDEEEELEAIEPKMENEVPALISTFSNLVGFNRRIIDHLSYSIDSYNPVIAKLRIEIRVIQQIRDREIALRNVLLARPKQ